MGCEVKTDGGMVSFRTVDEIVRAACGDVYDDQQVYYERFEALAFRGWRELNLFVLKTVRKVFLPLDLTTNTVTLPADFIRYSFIGYINDCNERVPLDFNPDLANSLEKASCDCKCGCANPLCKEVKYDIAEETIIINGTPYIKTVKRMIFENSFVEESSIPTAVYENVNGVATIKEVVFETVTKNLCELEVKSCGCIENSSSNVSKLKACGCSILCCDAHCETFNVFPEAGIIQLDGLTNMKKLYLEYYGDLPCVNGDYMVPEIAFEAMVAFIKHMAIEDKKNVNESEKERKYQRWIAARKNVRKLRNRSKIKNILQALTMLPSYPVNTYPHPRRNYLRR